MTSSNSKAGLIGDPNNSTYIQDIPGIMDDGFKKQMTKQELIEKEKREIEAIKKVLKDQGMDDEEIEKHIGKNYQLDLEDIELRMP